MDAMHPIFGNEEKSGWFGAQCGPQGQAGSERQRPQDCQPSAEACGLERVWAAGSLASDWTVSAQGKKALKERMMVKTTSREMPSATVTSPTAGCAEL